MYRIGVTSHFSAAHSLRNYKGKCESLHGHNWRVEIAVSSAKLDSCGMVMDFSELKRMLYTVLEHLDHKHLNDLDYFREINPSSEEIARYIFINLEKIIAEKNCKLDEVKVWETENSHATYTA